MNDSEKKLFEKFIKTIDVRPSNTRKVFAIGFIGLVGTGKSFLAKKISDRLGLYIASNDKIRRFLNELGFKGVTPAQGALEKIAQKYSKYLYEENISHIIDADLIAFHALSKKIASDYGANFYLINVVCPEEIILERLKKRKIEIKNGSSNLSRATEKEYFKRKKELHIPLPLPETFFSIDTSQELNPQIDELVSKLKKEKVI